MQNEPTEEMLKRGINGGIYDASAYVALHIATEQWLHFKFRICVIVGSRRLVTRWVTGVSSTSWCFTELRVS